MTCYVGYVRRDLRTCDIIYFLCISNGIHPTVHI